MKRVILFALLVVAISSAFAQTAPVNPTSTQPKQFTPDYSKVVTLPIKLPLAVFSQYFYSLQNPGFETGDLQGKQITAIKQNNAMLIDSLYSNFTKEILIQQKAWAADTLKQFNNNKKLGKN